MTEFFKDVTKTLRLPPGTPVPVGRVPAAPSKITVFEYDAEHCRERQMASLEGCFAQRDRPDVTWINIDGIADLELIRTIGEHFDVHPLVLEDIVNTEQRPKIEDYDSYLFIVVKMFYRVPPAEEIVFEQVSLLVTPDRVISFQEREGDVFDEIRQRLRQNKGHIRKMAADYLAYCLLDALIDSCFGVLEWLGDQVEDLEERLLTDPDAALWGRIHRLKREVVLMRKQVWPLREVINILLRANTPIIKKSTGIYLRDLYDHTIQIIDNIESLRDIVSGMHDVYLSAISNKTNEVMKVLTIFAAIFIPLTFIAGIYGMNFRYMPELEWRYGYGAVLGFMMVVGLGLLFYFKHRKWM